MQQVAIGLGYSALGAAVAFIYGISAYCLGQVVYRDDSDNLDGLAVPIRVASGAAVFSLLFSIFAVLGIANKWIVISIPAIVSFSFSAPIKPTIIAIFYHVLFIEE